MQFRGFDLSQYTDGQKIKLDKRCIIVDSVRYETAIGGSNTVFVVEPFEISDKLNQKAKTFSLQKKTAETRKGMAT